LPKRLGRCHILGLAVFRSSTWAFPVSNKTFDGNRADVSTMEAVLRMVARPDRVSSAATDETHAKS
jgi:hypothetical protein